MPTIATMSVTDSVVASLAGTQGVQANVGRTAQARYTHNGTGATLGNQVYAALNPPLTVAAGATVTLDLTTGLVNPLGESISSTDAFAKVREIYLELNTNSGVASSVEVLGGANPQRLGLAGAVTLLPGQRVHLGSPTTAGSAVSGSAKNIRIVNNDGTNAAQVYVFVAGSKS